MHIATNVLHAVAVCLNQPVIKQTTKHILGITTFTFGAMQAGHLYRLFQKPCRRSHSDHWLCLQTAYKVARICSKISIILSALTSTPAIFLATILVKATFSQVVFGRIFGPHTIFAVNPWHPRHIASIVAVAFALQEIALSACVCVYQIYQNSRYTASTSCRQLSDVKWMVLFNTLFSRPSLHLANQLYCRLL